MKFARTALQMLVGVAQSPGGLSLISTFGGPAAVMVANFGAVGIQSALDATEAQELSEEDVAAHLASKGLKVKPFDPSTVWGVPS